MRKNQYTHPWTKREEEKLISEYSSKGPLVLSKEMNRSSSAISCRAKKLKLSVSSSMKIEYVEFTRKNLLQGIPLYKIAKQLQTKPSTLSQFCAKNGLNVLDYKIKNFAPRSSEGQKYRVKFELKKECEICSFNRIIEIAHIIPAKIGGPIQAWNCLSLCPNHHRLFDYNKLNKEELFIIQYRIDLAKQKMFDFIDMKIVKEAMKTQKGVEYPERLRTQIKNLFITDLEKRIA